MLASVLLSAVPVLAALAALFFLWSERRAPAWLLPVAWLVLPAAVLPFLPRFGIDKSIALATLLAMLLAYGWVAVRRQTRSPSFERARRVDAAELAGAGPRPSRTALRSLLVVPVSAVASGAFALFLLKSGPGDELDRILAASFGWMFAWAAAMVWSIADARRLRVFAGLVGCALLFSALFAWG